MDITRDHFKGKTAIQHLKEARAKGSIATAEMHGAEISGHFSAMADSGKDTALALLILSTILLETGFMQDQIVLIMLVFSLGWLFWKVGRSALLGFSRLERLHRVIEEERWEIEHNRKQEKEELTELYRAKGLEGKLLTDVIDTLMADDNRLLKVMLEEELGLSLESYEHPLKQCFGAFIGAAASALIFFTTLTFFPGWAAPASLLVSVAFFSFLSAKLERNLKLESTIWNLSIALFSGAGVYFLSKLLRHALLP